MDNRDFQENDEVVYGLHGKGTISGVESMTINGETHEFLKLSMASKSKNPKAEVLIPRDRAREMGLRHLIDENDLSNFFATMAATPSEIDLTKFNWEKEEKKIHTMLSRGKEGLAEAIGQLHQTLRAMPVISPTVENAYKQLRSQVQVEVTQVLKKHHKAVRNLITDALGGDYDRPYRTPSFPDFTEEKPTEDQSS